MEWTGGRDTLQSAIGYLAEATDTLPRVVSGMTHLEQEQAEGEDVEILVVEARRVAEQVREMDRKLQHRRAMDLDG